jgi:hypothetical protein
MDRRQKFHGIVHETHRDRWNYTTQSRPYPWCLQLYARQLTHKARRPEHPQGHPDQDRFRNPLAEHMGHLFMGDRQSKHQVPQAPLREADHLHQGDHQDHLRHPLEDRQDLEDRQGRLEDRQDRLEDHQDRPYHQDHPDQEHHTMFTSHTSKMTDPSSRSLTPSQERTPTSSLRSSLNVYTGSWAKHGNSLQTETESSSPPPT